MTSDNITMDIDNDGIALITWDMPERSMNVLSEESIRDYGEAIERVISDEAIKGTVVTSAKKDFIAGADLNMFDLWKTRVRDKSPQEAARSIFDWTMTLQTMLRRLETCGKPVAAALPGTALGGGFEVALATHYRVCADNPKAQLGLPECKIGLMPGGGGTQRLTRLLGVIAAAPIIMEGRPLKPQKALALGVIHQVVAKGAEVDAAKAWLRGQFAEADRARTAKVEAGRDRKKLAKAVASFMPPWDQPRFKIPGGGPFSPSGFPIFMGAAAQIRKNTYGLYEAQKAILAAVYEGLQLPFDTALEVETSYFTKLALGAQSGNMIRSLFVSKQALDKGARRPGDVPEQKVKKLGVLGGGGFMGAGIANVSAAAGIEVVVLDRDEASAAKAKTHAEKSLAGRIKKGRMSEAQADAILARITTTADYAQLEGCDLVVEAVFEHPDVKRDVTKAAEQHLPETAIFASNTSTIPITELAKNSKRPESFIGIHFFSPVEKMPLVEIIMAEKTGDIALAKALDYVRQLRKTPIVVKDARFFYANRCVLRYIEEAHYMLAEGVKPALIENAALMVGMPVGPLALNDETALDLGVKIAAATKAALGDAYKPHPAEARIEQMVGDGRLGRKSGKGFYDYPADAKKHLWPGLAALFPLAAEQPDVDDLKKRFLTVQAVEAVRAIADGVVIDVREADVGAIFGWGFAPYSGGPISYIDTLGPAKFLADCEALEARFGNRFKAPDLLRDIAATGETFYGRLSPRQQAAAA